MLSHPRRARRPAFLAAFALLVLVAPALPPSHPPVGNTLAESTAASTAPVVQLRATVSWNGHNLSDARGFHSAFPITYSSSALLAYHWSAPASAVPVPVSTARLELFFFGYGVGARDVSQSASPTASNGTINLTWDGANALRWLAEGTYVAVASLLDSGGSTLWSESFYLKVTAPYSVLALIPIVLLILGIFEVAALLRSGYEPPAHPAPKPPGRGNEKPPEKEATPPAEEDGTKP